MSFYEAAVDSQAPLVCRCQSHDADEAMGRSRAAFYSRFLVSDSLTAHHVIRIGGRRNLRDDPRRITTQNALTRLLVASPVAATALRRRQSLRIKRRVIAPERKQDATEAARQGDHRNAPPAPRGEAIDPRPQRRHCRHAPAHPRRLNQQTAQLARARPS